MRGWLMTKLAGLTLEEIVIPMGAAGTPAIKQASPSGLVPYLEHDGAKVWDSLAIAEYCAELAPALWPEDRLARAHARAISAEMHSGFRALRTAMPMNLGGAFAGKGRTPEALADIARVEAVLAQTRARFGAHGPFLFSGNFNAADAMFAPVVARFLAFQPVLTGATHEYCKAVRAHPLVAEWYDLAVAEPAGWLLDKYESIT